MSTPKLKIVFAVLVVCFGFGCKRSTLVENEKKEENDSLQIDTSYNDIGYQRRAVRSIPVKMYTFLNPAITGDFNGDGKQEDLQSQLYSRTYKKIITQLPEECEWGCICDYDPQVQLKSNSATIPILYPGEQTCQLYGIAKISNIGDVDNNGSDDIAIIMHYAELSGLNTCYLYGMCNNEWRPLFRFSISESELFVDDQYCPDPYDIKDQIFQKNGEYYYSVFVVDRDQTKKLQPLSACDGSVINKTNLTRNDFTGTWENGNKDYYFSIEVKKDTVIYFDCSDGKTFPGVRYEWVGDTLAIYEDNLLGNIFRHTFYLTSRTTINCSREGYLHRLTYQPAKESDCGFF